MEKPVHTEYLIGRRDGLLAELLENETFCSGVGVGISLYEQKVIAAHERKAPLKIGDNLYYVQDGRERLAEMLGRILK